MDKEKLEAIAAPILSECGFEITDFKLLRQNGKPLLQLFVDREIGGVTLDDCADLTEKVGAYLDMNNIIEGGYIIEVSSPGMDRVLRREKDFKKFTGSKVKVRLKKPLAGARVYYGAIVGFENGQVLLSGDLKFGLDDIEEARLNPDDEEIFKKG